MKSARRWWRWPLLVALVGLTVTCIAAYVVLVSTGDISSNPVDLPLALLPLVWTLPGLLVLRKADWHPVGWLLVAIGLGYCFDFDLAYFPVWEHVFTIPRPWAAWIIDGWGNFTAFSLTVALLTVFPDGLAGRPVGERRWGWARIILAMGAIAISAMQTTVGGHEGNTFPVEYPNPTGLGFVPPAVGAVAVILTILILIAASLFSLRQRAHRASEATRRQYTWVLFPFASLFGMITLAIPLSTLIGEYVWLPVVFMYFVIPVAFSMAMVKYRWFDIDRVVSRTVTYGVVALVVGGVYAVPVVWLPDALGLSSDLTVAGATLAAAAVFTPLRRWVQRRVDRRFNRARYDAEQVVASFAERLQSAVDVGVVGTELGGAAVLALNPAHVMVWIREAVERSGAA